MQYFSVKRGSSSVSYCPDNIYELVLFRLINWYIIQSVQQHSIQYNVKFKMLYLINENACVFRYFATGQSFRSLAFSFRMDHYTVGKIVDQVSDVLWSKLSSKHLAVPDHDRFLDIAVKFRERWNFPNVIGCIDGKHIRIKCPTKAGSLFYNYKQFFFRSITRCRRF